MYVARSADGVDDDRDDYDEVVVVWLVFYFLMFAVRSNTTLAIIRRHVAAICCRAMG